MKRYVFHTWKGRNNPKRLTIIISGETLSHAHSKLQLCRNFLGKCEFRRVK